MGYVLFFNFLVMQNKNLAHIPTTFLDENKEEWRYTTLFTDVGNFEILKPMEELKKEIDEAKASTLGLFKYRKLEEHSQILEHYWELVLDMNVVKILWFKEHHIIYDLKKEREIKPEDNLEV